MTDGTFSPIDDGDEQTLGPQAVLLCGFSSEEIDTIESLLQKIGAGDHRILRCTETMLGRRLGEALETAEEDPPLPPDKLPRAMVLSGLEGRQINELLKRFPSTDLVRPIFSTTTPSNLEFTVRELLVHLIEEHRAMMEQKARE